nr:metallophosphoesterase [uncultured Oscillibacter sp.]
MLKFIHAADFHLDSAFAALPAGRAAERRRESRELAFRLADYVNGRGVQLVLLAGDLFDSAAPYRETGEALAEALGRMRAQVFAAPGNHDWCGPGSPWDTVDWPENVHIFQENAMTSVDLPELDAAVHGAAFTSAEQGSSLLAGFAAPEDGRVHLGVLHGEIDPPPPAFPTWPWGTSISGGSRSGTAVRSAPGPAASRAGALTNWGKRAFTRGSSTVGGMSP